MSLGTQTFGLFCFLICRQEFSVNINMNVGRSKQRGQRRKGRRNLVTKHSIQKLGRDHTLRFCLKSLGVGGQGSFEEEGQS